MKNLFGPKTFVWWEIFLVKLSLLSMGIAVGSYWSAFFLPYAIWFAAFGLVLGLYLASTKLMK